MYILGISAYYHDSSAVLLHNGKVIAAFEEERFTKIKHDNNFPYHAIEACLKQAAIEIKSINYVSYYEKPLLKFERVLDTFIQTYPFSLSPFVNKIAEVIDYKINVESVIRKKLGFKGEIYFVPHHYSHASAAYYPSPFKKAAILTIDGVGEYTTTALWKAENNSLTLLKELVFPHSLGLFYSTFTSYLGFQVNEGEYKMMGLAAYGKPKYKKDIQEMIDAKPDGSFQLQMKYFPFRESFQMYSDTFIKKMGKPRAPSEKVTKRHQDIAASVQAVTEDIYLKILRHLYNITNIKNICIAGGVGLNAVANGKIAQYTTFEKSFIFGPAGDSGAALGSALFTYHTILKKKRMNPLSHLSFGTRYENDYIKKLLEKKNIPHTYFKNEKPLIQAVVKLLAENRIVGWFYGRMEFGPRALGNRSLLVNPNKLIMKKKINAIKQREMFRPFACSVLEKELPKLFHLHSNQQNYPFMNMCFMVKPEWRKKIAAVVHADNTCRVQTVNKTSARYFKLIQDFYKKTKIPCLLNTSLNRKGQPIVESPTEAIDLFLDSKLDYFVIENFLLHKK